MRATKLFGVVCLVIAGAALIGAGVCYAADATVTSPPEISPGVKQFVGNTNAYLEPALWPQFQNIQGDNQECTALLGRISLTPKSGQGDWQDVISSIDMAVEPQYAKTGKILVTWTIRILGSSLEYPVWAGRSVNMLPPALQSKAGDPELQAIISRLNHGLCSWWHGSVNQSFPGGTEHGKIYTRLVDAATGKALGREIVMTLPDGGMTSNTVVSDPTHSGSVLITPDMYGGTLPARIKFKVQWKNTTPMLVYSDAGMRSLIITITRE